MNFFNNCVKGIAIGAGAILPGISSGVLCVIFGLYEKLLNSILHFFKDIKKNIKFLMPIIIGCFFGVVLFGKVLNYFLYEFPIQTKSLFIGFILASTSSIARKINSKEKFKFNYIFCFLFALLIGIGSVVLENYLPISSTENINFIYLILCGFFMSIGIVVPGVSSTIILTLLGVYSIYLSSVSNLFLPVLIPIGIGLVIGGFIFMKLIKYFIDNHYACTFYSIIGFTLGSILVLIPTCTSTIEFVISLLCIVLGFLLVSLIGKY